MAANNLPIEIVTKLREEYIRVRPLAERLEKCLHDQLSAILIEKSIPLAVPMEHRVKSFESVLEKCDRKGYSPTSISELGDVVGLRMILLFRGDVETLDEIISDVFEIIEHDDASSRLDETQFGYQSNHYAVLVPQAWCEVPNYRDLRNMTAEIQVRTLAQHMWAAASHELQYKREESVPIPIRRTIHRVSALLETIDLEFSRVIEERSKYLLEVDLRDDKDTKLNVDSLKAILKELLPPERELGNEMYDDLLKDLQILGKDSPQWLRDVISKRLADAVKEEDLQFEEGDELPSNRYRARGFIWNYVGLARQCLRAELGGDRVDLAMKNRILPSTPPSKAARKTKGAKGPHGIK